jgi:hypothetical protein
MVIDVLKDFNAFIFMVGQSKSLGLLDLCNKGTTVLSKVHYCLPVDVAYYAHSMSDVLNVHTCTDGQSCFIVAAERCRCIKK